MISRRSAAIIPALSLVVASLSAIPAFAEPPTDTGNAPEQLQIRKVDAADGQLIGRSSASAHQVAHGARFAGNSCTRTVDDPTWNCTSVSYDSWFATDLPQNGNTGTDISDQIPAVSGDDLQEFNATESVAPTGYQITRGTATVKRTADGTWDVVGTLPAGVTLTHSGQTAYLTWADTAIPVVHPTATVTHIPAVTQTVTTPAHHLAVVQLDTYFDSYGKKPMTKAQIAQREAARKSDKANGTLVYRSGSAGVWLWGSTNSVFKTLDVCSLPTLAPNQDAWVLGTGASPALPWGANHKVVQTSPTKIDCNPVTTTVVVTPAHDVTTYQCPDGTAPADKTTPLSADSVCSPSGTVGGGYSS